MIGHIVKNEIKARIDFAAYYANELGTLPKANGEVPIWDRICRYNATLQDIVSKYGNCPSYMPTLLMLADTIVVRMAELTVELEATDGQK
jgi:hypothetical protein